MYLSSTGEAKAQSLGFASAALGQEEGQRASTGPWEDSPNYRARGFLVVIEDVGMIDDP